MSAEIKQCSFKRLTIVHICLIDNYLNDLQSIVLRATAQHSMIQTAVSVYLIEIILK